MKNVMQLCARVLPWLLFLFATEGFCRQAVHCQWGPYGDWSECDGCTKLQTRSRAMAVYTQFGGNPCSGARTETRSCTSTNVCPVDTGCGDRFRCRSGKCVSQSLVCNGDQDCEEDGLDENQASCSSQNVNICPQVVLPPQIQDLGQGFDVTSGMPRGNVINTKSFGGQCRTVFSGVHGNFYRLPLSITKYSFMVTVKKDFSDEMYNSKWHYAKDIVKRQTVTGTTTGHRNYDYHETHDQTKTQRLLVLRNDIELAQFQNNAAQYLPIAEEFWKALAKLPSVYDYSAYRKVLEKFGTHYLSEGSLGGSLEIIARVDEETVKKLYTESWDFEECVETKRWFLFFPIYRRECKRGSPEQSRPEEYKWSIPSEPSIRVTGGGPSHQAALMGMQIKDPEKNWQSYSDWAESVRSFPRVTKQKLQPLSELVKEVQCAGVKRLYLRRAIEQYLSESDACHCQSCSNNGLAILNGNECKCVCKPGTTGPACDQGIEMEGQPGVIHGSWACWSAWSLCSNGRRSRSRSCSNPSPQNGGQMCIGQLTETSACEDQELQHFKTMEPQCFDFTLPPSQKCGAPPALINGYIRDPKDVYLVGSKVEYLCTEDFHLVGQSTIECNADRTWSARPGLCKSSRCYIRSLAEGVTASPLNQSYQIGESVTLSCPEGRQLLGEATVICDPSLHFSPNPAEIKCSEVSPPQPTTAPSVQCKLWQKSSRGSCVCKMPFECSSSLELCATSSASGRSILLNVCKMHALQCMGKNNAIAEDSACTWPDRSTAGCTSCHMWENCDGQTNECRCKDSADCSTPGLNVCVRVGENVTVATQTMSECEAGLRRCKGEKVSVVSILPCTS